MSDQNNHIEFENNDVENNVKNINVSIISTKSRIETIAAFRKRRRIKISSTLTQISLTNMKSNVN